MNILYIEQSLDPSRGGIERVTHSISSQLQAIGHKCYFAYTDKDCTDIEQSVKIKISLSSGYNAFHNQLSDFIASNDIDTIIIQDNPHKYIHQFLAEAKESRPLKSVYCFHVTPDYWRHFRLRDYFKQLVRHPGKDSLLRIARASLGRDKNISGIRDISNITDRTILLSESFIQPFVKIYSINDTSKVSAISNPLTFTDNNTFIGNKSNTVLIVSRFSERQKNLKSALRIWKMIESASIGWNLKIIGYGEDEAEIKSYAKSLSVKNVTFEGKIINIREHYEDAKLFMMTSHFEGFGMTLIEAQQLGCVPIAFDTFSALHDIITNELDGYIITPGDEKGYAQCCLELMTDKKKLKTASEHAIRNCSKFSLARIGDSWNRLLMEL